MEGIFNSLRQYWTHFEPLKKNELLSTIANIVPKWKLYCQSWSLTELRDFFLMTKKFSTFHFNKTSDQSLLGFIFQYYSKSKLDHQHEK